MLRLNSLIETPRLVFNITNNEESTQHENVYNSILEDVISKSINPIFDNEVMEFKPESSELSFYIFFSAFKNLEWLKQIQSHVEESFGFYLEDSKSIIASKARQTITNPKALLQSFGVPAPRPQFFFHKKRVDAIQELPYVILDPVEHLTVSLPTKEGLPVFYNSFSLPFGKNIEKWSEDILGFSNKTFLYNSFLLMDVYTTNNLLTQKKIMSIPVYINGRYMDHEVNTNGVKQIRPAMYLADDTEGFSLIWLKKHNLEKLYVKFSFWDALNGEQISLLPSSENTTTKKWVQDPNKFKLENLYLEYRLDYVNRTYGIYEYNETSAAYDTKATSFDLYQLIYDEYFAKLTRINNTRPFRLQNITESQLEGEDVNLTLSRSDLRKTVETTLDDNQAALDVIAKKYKETEKTLLGLGLHGAFEKFEVKLKDKALTYFEQQFDVNDTYNQDMGTVVMTNSTESSFRVRKIEIINVRVENKNNYFEGDPIIVNKYSRTNVTETPSYYLCDTIFSFMGSKFFNKVSPIKTSYDAVDAALYNNQSEIYSAFYFDEASNKVVERSKEDIQEALGDLTNDVKTKLASELLTKGGSVLDYIRNKKKYEAKVKGLNMDEKDMNLMLRNDVIEKGGTKARYELLFPATIEKLTAKTDDYRDFGISIKTSLTPQYESFDKGSSLTLNTDIIMGKEFFKLFISANDDITISYEVNVQFVDRDGKLYRKIIPCSLKYT